jgi:hypothetical protein
MRTAFFRLLPRLAMAFALLIAGQPYVQGGYELVDQCEKSCCGQKSELARRNSCCCNAASSVARPKPSTIDVGARSRSLRNRSECDCSVDSIPVAPRSRKSADRKVDQSEVHESPERVLTAIYRSVAAGNAVQERSDTVPLRILHCCWRI